MEKKLALLVYPEFSLQEVMNLTRLFRWDFEIFTEVISTEIAPVKSEEGIFVLPVKTTEEFREKDYLCMVLPGCSNFTEVFKDKKIFDFLNSFKAKNFLIGAICSGPLLLAKAGLLKGKKFTSSIYMDFFDFLPFLERNNYVPSPIVVDGNIVTAGGANFNGFAVTMAHKLGFSCPEKIFSGYTDHWKAEDYEVYLPKEAVEETKAMFSLNEY